MARLCTQISWHCGNKFVAVSPDPHLTHSHSHCQEEFFLHWHAELPCYAVNWPIKLAYYFIRPIPL